MRDPMRILAGRKPEKRWRKSWTTTVQPKAGPCPWLIRCWREVRGLSQRDCTRLCGWGENDTTLSRIENYKWPVTEHRLYALAKALKVKPLELCTLTDFDAEQNADQFAQWVKAKRPPIGDWMRGMVKS